MTKIGRPAPHFRAPALVGGDPLLLDSAGLRGRSYALCFLPPLGLHERMVLERHVPDFEDENTRFLGVVDEGALFFGPWQRDLWLKRLILTGDPLGQLSRRFGLSRYQPHARCRSFIVDARGILRYDLVHDLNGRGISVLLEMLKACQASSASQPAISEEALGRLPILA